METTARDLRALERRVERLEHLVVQVICGAAATALLLGLVLDFVPTKEGSEAEDSLPRLLTAGFKAIAYRDSDGNPEGFAIAAGIGFLGLLLVTFLTLWQLADVASAGAPTERTARTFGIAVTVMLVGTAIAGLIALVGLSSDEADVGWGVVVFGAGGALCLLLLRSEVRRWWDPALGR